ncbi:MAG: sigma-54-dependent Fis family transcriptional regulator [Deltaproteobacteria bacterium]|nr:sigma-54-dependent Fis family transcriptional regulator [Deltaproteobacteria bacterium]MBW2199817.1 sigma-54-dependent Fis family transcriptional regulator [Deltaproteobacteria bacterium]
MDRRKRDRTFNPFKDILVIDDESNMRHVLSVILKKTGYNVTTAAEGKEGLALFEDKDYDAVLCDIKMPQMDGIDFLKSAVERKAEPAIIMMSGYGTVNTAVEAMKLGAVDYISKPFKPDEILVKLKQTEERMGLRRENTLLRDAVRETFDFQNIVGRSKIMRDIFKTVQKISDHKTTVLITGESGTGKELIAKAIHYNGVRKNSPLVVINCGGLPEHILESELFGHVQGAFTGAVRDKKGLFQEASGGTLFLDEIGELPVSLQVKLLRALQDEEIRPLGTNRSFKVDIRVVAATAKDLAKEVQKNTFRDDLYYRINVLPIYLPPLRERKEDLPFLIDHFIRKFNVLLKKSIRGIDPPAVQRLMERDWKGNVRELENIIQRTMVMMDRNVIGVQDLPSEMQEEKKKEDFFSFETLSIKENNVILHKLLIEKALKQTKGNRTRAAKLLEISHPTLLIKMKQYSLEY